MDLNKKLIVLIILFLLIAVFGLFLKYKTSLQPVNLSTSNKIIITTSFYPLYSLAQEIGGEKVGIINITPAGAEPHDYEPTPQDIVKIQSSKILLLNGNGLDPWGDKLIPTLVSRGVVVLKMSERINPLIDDDPHFWLDPVLYEKMANIVADSLIKVDKNNQEYYQNNLNNYIKKLNKLNRDYEQGLKSCQTGEIIVSHNAFSYVAARYHFTTLYIAGLSPDEEPSPKRIAEIARIAKQKHIKYIFFETLVSPKIADTIAKEIGAQTLVLNPLEGLTENEIKSGKNYISIMEDNLTNLRKAGLCQ